MRPWHYDTLLDQLSARSPSPVQRGVAIARAVGRRAARRWGTLLRFRPLLERAAAAGEPGATRCRALLDSPVSVPPTRARPRVVHAIGSLSAGGAERQLAVLAASCATRGEVEPVIVVVHGPEGAAGHYAPIAHAAGVPIEVAGAELDPGVVARLEGDPRLVARLASLPRYLRPYVSEMAGEFLRLKPDCVHAWLDHQNIWAGVAALAVGVPQVVLSTRNVNPMHFPYLAAEWFREWYSLLLESPRVTILNNSRAGAEDYAAWIGVPTSRFHIVLNGIDPSLIRAGSADDVARVRDELLGERRLLVGGVFRLSEEKQPMRWLDIVRATAEAHPDAKFFHAGEGALARDFSDAARDLVDAGRLKILGRRSDVPTLLAASDALLHAARFEGTPNVLLEAQQLGCPLVATTAGGTPDAVDAGRSGYLHDPGDLDGLRASLSRVLSDAELRRTMSAAGRRWIEQRFGLDRMVDETLACYTFGARR